MINYPERNKEIVELKDSGMTYQQLSEKYELSRERVRQIYSNEMSKRERINRYGNAKFYDAIEQANTILNGARSLPIKIMNGLLRAGIIREMNETGCSISRWSDEQLLRIRGFGIKIVDTIRLANDVLIQNSE